MPNEDGLISLDEALTPEPTGAEAPQKEAPEAPAEVAETPEAEAAPPAAEKKDDPNPAWHLAAVLDEREKRQAAQRELEELRKQIAASQSEKQKTSVLDDEPKFRTEIIEEVRSEIANERLNMSQAFAEREFGKDVLAAKVEAFKALAAGNPELRTRFASAPSPYHALVDIVDKHTELKEMENVDAYKEKLRAEIRAELLKETQEKEQGVEAKRAAITPSLASRRSSGGGVKNSGSLLGVDDVFKS